MKQVNRYFRDKKGINTILAALLMVVIVVVASVMVYAWSTGLLGTLLVTPTTGKEALNMNSNAFPNNNNVTLYLQNSGSVAITFTTYYAKNATTGSFTQSAYTWGPTIQPNQPGIVQICVSTTNCGGGTFTAGTFSFVSGNAYTITLVTSRNNQFTFSVTR
jgi:FlaG/FlaF family flagellin (archaellin)